MVQPDEEVENYRIYGMVDDILEYGIDEVNFDSVNTGEGTTKQLVISDPEGEPQQLWKGIDPNDPLQDEDGQYEGFELGTGTIIQKHPDNSNTGFNRMVLGRNIGIGVRKNNTLDNGEAGGTGEFIKNPPDTGSIILENDFGGTLLSFEKKGGGAITFKTGVDGAEEEVIDEIVRFDIADTSGVNAGDDLRARFLNMDYIQVGERNAEDGVSIAHRYQTTGGTNWDVENDNGSLNFKHKNGGVTPLSLNRFKNIDVSGASGVVGWPSVTSTPAAGDLNTGEYKWGEGTGPNGEDQLFYSPNGSRVSVFTADNTIN